CSSDLSASEKGFYRLLDAVNLLDNLPTSTTSSMDISAWKQTCYNAMNDDFNTPILIAHLFEAVKLINQVKDDKASITKEDLALLKETIHAFMFDVMGLRNTNSIDETGNTDKLSATVQLLIKLRQEARDNKDFALSDQIRDELD